MKPMSRKVRTMYFSLFAVLFVVLTPAIFLYAMGYRLGDAYSLVERGGIYVYVDEPGSTIYLNGNARRVTGIFQREFFAQNLRPDQYFVMVHNDNYWPWTKYVLVREKRVTALYPFLLKRNLVAKEVEQYEPVATSTPLSRRVERDEYTQIAALFEVLAPATTTVPSRITAPTSTATTSVPIERKKVSVWDEETVIFAKWLGEDAAAPTFFCENRICTDPLHIVTLEDEDGVRTLEFYPGRNDAIIFSGGDAIFVTELDTREYHTSYPIFKGKEPDFRLGSGDTLYVKDGEYIGIIEL